MAEALATLPAIAGPVAAPASPAVPNSPALPASPGAPTRPAGPGSGDPACGAGEPGPGGPGPGPSASLPIRSAERRRWAADLTGPALAGLVLYGAGGIGKSTLASQIASRVSYLEPEHVTVVASGDVSVDGLLAGVAAALCRHPAMTPGSVRAESVQLAGRAALPWADRMTLLCDQILGDLPVLLVLDNFDASLTAKSGDWAVRDPALAELIARWASASHRGKMLITCRHPFTPPAAAGPPLGFRHVGPLSRSGAFELAKSLPALGQLGEPELDRAWRLVGGHPQAMNYLDTLLATREGSFPDTARRLAHAIGTAAGGTVRPTGPAAPTELPPEAAETIALAAVEVLLGTLQDPAPRAAPVTGGHRRHPGAWRSRRLATMAAAVALVAAAAGVVVASHPGPSMAQARTGAPARTTQAGQARAGQARGGQARAGHALARHATMLGAAAAVRTRAAAWMARQVSRDAIVACDPAMCSALLARGIPSGNLLKLGVSSPDPLGSDVVVATAAVRSQFGGRLASVYAPGILASFGSGSLRIDVRAIAPDGATAYETALAADLADRRVAGRQLVGNPRLKVSAAARAALWAGQVDPRLLTTLATLAATSPASTGSVQVSAFGDSGPGASQGMPLRSAQITEPFRADLGRLRGMVAFVRAQRPPYLPAQALITTGAGGSPVLSIGFSAPSPAGLLQP
jgi:hypothetical protein